MGGGYSSDGIAQVSGAARAAVQRPAELLADVQSLDRLVALSGRARVLLSELTLQAGRDYTRLHESTREYTRVHELR